MSEFNKYMKRVYSEVIMRDQGYKNVDDAVSTGTIKSAEEHKKEVFAKEPSQTYGNMYYMIMNTTMSSDRFTIISPSEAAKHRVVYMIAKNPDEAQFQELSKRGQCRSVIYKGILFVGNEFCIHEHILDFLDQIYENELTRCVPYSIEKNNFSCWQIDEDYGRNVFLLSESYTNSYEELYNYINWDSSDDEDFEDEDDSDDHEKEFFQKIKTLFDKSIDTLSSNMKNKFDFILKMYDGC